MPRKTLSVQQRTHQRLTALNNGFDDSMEKILTRLITFYLKWKDRVDELEIEP